MGYLFESLIWHFGSIHENTSNVKLQKLAMLELLLLLIINVKLLVSLKIIFVA